GLQAQDTMAVAYHGVEVGDGSFGPVRGDDLPGTRDLGVFVPTQVGAQVGHDTSFGVHSATCYVGHVRISGHAGLPAALDAQADGFGVTILPPVGAVDLGEGRQVDALAVHGQSGTGAVGTASQVVGGIEVVT